MIDFSQPITPGALLQAGSVIVAAITFFAGMKWRLTSLEKKVGEATTELHELSKSLVTLAVQSVRLDALEAEIIRLRERTEGTTK